ncbi:TniB family NTP-binding protein [Geodermatophilus sp. DSM 44513]|uniref:TniB family NTP-binding protein n=1 Tax=Geodermatophilus sp. DSM 44513 TaxID=1528104 RepID=UPI00127230F1|nr:TniB family NTP-binding protein [Geodermatophilus sp. DSM 44513]WNV74455.1 AAA family ATPase [Geodermatophilus sp. DSM 44513]
MTRTVPAPPDEWSADPPPRQEITTLDGWQHYVEHREDYRAPALLTRADYDRLPEGHRGLYDMARETAIGNLPRHETPMGQALMNKIALTLRANTVNTAPGVRPGMFVSADAGLGKSTLVCEIAARFDEAQRQRAQFFPSIAGNRDRWVPVAWLSIGSEVTINGLCRDLLGFYGEVPPKRAYGPELTARVRKVMVDCGTLLLVLDDITRLKMHREADQNAADFIRSLMETGATILGIGVDIPGSGLLNEGQASTRRRRLLTQTRARFTVHSLGSFTDETGDAYTRWLSHLKAVEEDLPLLDKAPGMLTDGDTPAYLLRRTRGVVGTLTRLMTEASLAVLGQRPTGPGTGEYLTREILDYITLDDAAENQGLAEPTELSPRASARRTRPRNGAFNGRRARDGAA